MARVVVGDDLGRITLDGRELPGLYQSATIDAELELDRKRRPGKSGFSKQPKGFNDATVKVRVHLIYDENDNEPLSQIQTISRTFFGWGKKGQAQVLRLVNPTINSFGIKRVLFDKVRVVDTNRTDVVVVDLHFTQYRPVPKVRRRKRKVPSIAAIERSQASAEAALQKKLDALNVEAFPQLAPIPAGSESGRLTGLQDYRAVTEQPLERLLREDFGHKVGPNYPYDNAPAPEPTERGKLQPDDNPPDPFVDSDVPGTVIE